MRKLLIPAILIGVGLIGCASEPESIIESDSIEADNPTIATDKETFKQKVEARLQEFENKLEELRKKAADARAEIRAKLRQEIDELHGKATAARQRLDQMWQNGADRWEEERERLEAALDDLRVAFERAFSHAS